MVSANHRVPEEISREGGSHRTLIDISEQTKLPSPVTAAAKDQSLCSILTAVKIEKLWHLLMPR